MVPATDDAASTRCDGPGMTELIMSAASDPTELDAPGRRVAVAAPLIAVFSIGVGAPLYADDLSEAAATGRFVLANATALAVLLLLALALVALHRRQAAAFGRFGHVAFAMALVGTAMAVGGTWDQVFAVPHLADEAPAVLDAGASGSLLVGYLLSYLALAVGWALFAIATLRAKVLSKAGAIVLLIGAIFAILPSPTAIRILPLAIGAALVTRPRVRGGA